MNGGTALSLTADTTGHAVVASNAFYGGGLTVTRFNPQGTGVTFSRNVAGEDSGGLAVDAASNTYFFDSVLPSVANYPARNSLLPCTGGGQEALTVFDGNGTILQSTYVQGGPYPLGVFVRPDSTVDLFSGSLAVTHFAQNPLAQTVQLACIGSAASWDNTAVSPGEIVSLFGSGLGPATGTQAQLDAAGKFPAEAADVQVTFNGTPSPLLYVQDSQINAIAPWSLQAGQQAEVCVVYNGTATNCLHAAVAAAHHGVFTVAPYMAAALDQDGTLNSASNPAKVGAVVSIFATGLGAIDPLPPNGSIVGLPLPVDVLPVSMSTISATQGANIPITVDYAGPAPFEVAGVSQINFRVDANVGGLYATFLYVGASGSEGQSNPFYIYVAQ